MENNTPDIDPQETQEWMDAFDSVLENEGADRAHYLIGQMIHQARLAGDDMPISATTPYFNTIPLDKEQRPGGNQELEHRIRALMRWNAMVLVLNANRESSELGGHIASFASAATLYDVGFNYFFHGQTDDHGGDLVYFQGHSSPGMYARAYLEGRISEEQMYRFRQEVDGGGLSSYPHPWLMPDFWQFPTVSMGLGPLMAIYQARFMRYLQHRGIVNTEGRKVWAFLGDGETDEPESLGAISMAGRENLDNLIFVINCNLQRLDGPVRGNGKIIQELEGVFRGAGWNVIKVIWGSRWDRLFAKDKTGLLLKRMEEVVDGEYQTYKSKDGAYVRQHFFGKYPELLELVADMSDDEIWRLNRGGHDPFKVFAAYAAASRHQGQPTVILAKTVKGYGMGEAGEGQNITHQQKKVGEEALRKFRDRFNIPVTDEQLPQLPFFRPAADSQEAKYLLERNQQMGTTPMRKPVAPPLQVPALEAFDALLKSTEEREISTTMAFVRILGILTKDKNIGKLVVPIVPDESRTFGMEGMFRQLGIFSQQGQLYTPQDADQLMFYKENQSGQILQEGINEAGGMADWIAAATSYANHGTAMIPFYIYYSMFGFQRVGDLAWAAGDMRARGFLLGGTAGRTTLNGEGSAAPGRPQPPAGRANPELRQLRPDLRLRTGGDHPERPVSHDAATGRCVLLPNGDERELHPPGDAERRRAGHHQGHVPVQGTGNRGQETGKTVRSVIGQRDDFARGDCGGGTAGEGFRHRIRRVERDQFQRAAPRRSGLRTLEHAASGTTAPDQLCRAMPGAAPRPGNRRDRLHQELCRPDSPLHPRALQGAGHGRLRPFRHAQETAPFLRGGSLLRHRGRAQGTGR